MADKQRYRSGPQKVATGLIKAGVKAQIGDLVTLLDDYVTPAGVFPVTGSGSGPGGAGALLEFKQGFIGTLIEGAASGAETVDTPCLVGYAATYEYDLDVPADANYPPGTPVEAVVGTGFLEPQQVALVATRTTAIATLARELREGELTAQIETVSSVMQNPLA